MGADATDIPMNTCPVPEADPVQLRPVSSPASRPVSVTISLQQQKQHTEKSQRHEKTIEILAAYRRRPSVHLRNRLVELNIGLVRRIAHRFCKQSTVPYEDLEQLGSLGLIRAIERFDPQHGYAFSSFAVPYIRGEILHYLRDQSTMVRIPRRWQTLQRQGQQAILKLSTELGHPPTDAEVAQALGVSVSDWRSAKQSQLNHVPMSLDAQLGSHPQSAESCLTLGDLLPDARDQDHQHIEEDRQQLQRALSQLEDQTRQILELIYLKNMTRKQTAHHIGVSPMTITRRVQRGLAQLNSLMQN